VSEPDASQTLNMGEMSARSGVSEGTLRMWESRHAFPVPQRLPSGHRRYTELDLRRVQAVLKEREQGLSLTTAIERARLLTDEPLPSVYSTLRAAFPHLLPYVLTRTALTALSHAIEDESCARAERPILFGCFQRERHYRHAEPRWREMARTAEFAVVLADFAQLREPEQAPIEVPIPDRDPLLREWVVVVEGPSLAACLAGFERPGQHPGNRSFETVWSVERPVVREAARTCRALTARFAPDVVAGLGDRLAGAPATPLDELRSAVDLTTRMVLYATAPE
jgi:DICT domain-containing protein